MKCLKCIVAALALVHLTVRGALIDGSAPGQVDLSFDFENAHAPNGTVRALAVQPDGKVLVGGYFTKIGTTSRAYLARLTPDGAVETSFDAKIGTGANYFVYALKVQPDGRVLVGGRFSSIEGKPKASLARLNPDGTLDTNFATRVTSGGPFPNVYSLGLQPDGRILVGGNFGQVNGESRNGIARLNADGTLDAAFNPGKGTGYYRDVYSVAVQVDGKIILGGNFRKVDGHDRADLARLHPDGQLDLEFTTGTSGRSVVNFVGVQPDGKILVAGDFTSIGRKMRPQIARLHADGSLDESFNPGHGTANKASSGEINTVALQTDGKVVIGGRFSSVQGKGRNDIARLNADGTVDRSFRPMSGTGAAENYVVYSVALQTDQSLLIGGRFSSVNLFSRTNVARLLN
jgi:uncharacterized delta-60 repeat protein